MIEIRRAAAGDIVATAPDNASARALYESCGWRPDGFQHYELLADRSPRSVIRETVRHLIVSISRLQNPEDRLTFL
ncbi:MAG TPA: hypothetical protein VJP45_13590 [Candidatus Limnocylindria bacterium]|nr:hypothetical protein [Candidatus Limnocylindria bacterium]